MKEEVFYPNKDSALLSLGKSYGDFHTKVKDNLDALFLANGAYSTVLTFDGDKDVYKDATGLSITFTLDVNGASVNGAGIILRLNKPTTVTFPANFEASPSSAPLDATKLNVYSLVYFSNWNGAGVARVIYSNTVYVGL